MNFQKLINAVIFLALLSTAKGQGITSKDLIGFWHLDMNHYEMPIEFFDNLKFLVIPDPTQDFWSKGHYSLTRVKEANVLELDIDSNAFAGNRKIYIIQRLTDYAFKVQIPAKTAGHEIIYQWNKTDTTNTFYVYKMERKRATVN